MHNRGINPSTHQVYQLQNQFWQWESSSSTMMPSCHHQDPQRDQAPIDDGMKDENNEL